jgi:hypothetical protein
MSPGMSLRPPASMILVSSPVRVSIDRLEPVSMMRPAATATASSSRVWPSQIGALTTIKSGLVIAWPSMRVAGGGGRMRGCYSSPSDGPTCRDRFVFGVTR